MAGFINNSCIVEDDQGGFITRFLNHTTDHLIAPGTVFPGPMREFFRLLSQHLLLLLALTMTVMNYRGDDEDLHDWNPGNYDPYVR